MRNMTKSQVMLVGSIFGLAVIVWLWLMGDLALNPGAAFVLVLSLALGGGLIVATWRLAAHTFKDGFRGNFLMFILTGVVALITFGSLMFIGNIGFGASMRSDSMWSFLPEGNLLIAGGSTGWTIVILLLMMIVPPIFKKRKARKMSRMGAEDDEDAEYTQIHGSANHEAVGAGHKRRLTLGRNKGGRTSKKPGFTGNDEGFEALGLGSMATDPS